MAIVDGNFITIYQGETLDMVFAVVDEDDAAYDLTDGKAVLSYQKRGTSTVVNVNGVISTSTVTVPFTHATTQLMSSKYDWQLMCRDASDNIVMVREGQLAVRISLNADAAAV